MDYPDALTGVEAQGIGANIILMDGGPDVLRRRKKTKLWIWIGIWIAALLMISVVLPGIIVNKGGGWQEAIQLTPKEELHMNDNSITVPVYMTAQKEIVELPLEQYVRGVVAAEMPAEFELEALKAQAIAARTYIIRRMERSDFSNVPVEGAWVTDSVQHQAFMTEEQMKDRWGWFGFASRLDKLTQAVNETEGLIVTYEGEPIQATFFSTSNGYTENSEDYWGNVIPYLRSVPSPWDTQISPKYKQTFELPSEDVRDKLGLPSTVPVSFSEESFKSASYTKGKRIKEITIEGKTFSGREVREKLGLPSSQFTWELREGMVHITTFGYGHGVGMSQYGAQGMALSGKKADDILTYYYQGVQIEKFY
ncbi:stage II sporulation protein D [Marinicrinis lubricantis]|uniref:Stage II sporulation protein D n=1 Tax=Marinicrinis lubricantis TaxID=2086470 RepID=A0ABW1IKK3_9BACL